MRTIDAMKKLARNDGRFTHVYTKKELSELFNETGSKLNGTLKSLIKENILNRAYHNVYVFRFSQYGGLGTLDLIGKKIRPNDSFYESLESSASAWSLISQIPTVVTYMTTGKSKWYNTGYGSIDFVHYAKQMRNQEPSIGRRWEGFRLQTNFKHIGTYKKQNVPLIF